MSLNIDLRKIKEYLDNLEIIREKLIRQSRDILNLCRMIINKIVLGEDTKDLVENLQQQFRELYNIVKYSPELVYSNTFYSIVVEYVEAIQLYYIIKKRKVLQLEEIDVHPIPYLLGLTEVIGELKRVSLNLIRNDRFKEAYALLEVAESLYNNLTSLSYPDALLPGFRRKLDIYRKVIDDWKKFLIDMESRRKLIQNLGIALKHIKPEGLEG